jgi:hypothetical protein
MRRTRPPRLIVVDLYGNLISFGIMHHPFRELLKMGAITST